MTCAVGAGVVGIRGVDGRIGVVAVEEFEFEVVYRMPIKCIYCRSIFIV